MNHCRFRDLAGHQCARRDGRLIPAGDSTPCHDEARAQVLDEARLAAEVDAVTRPLVARLQLHRGAWGEAA
jgi:hypothetical protein